MASGPSVSSGLVRRIRIFLNLILRMAGMGLSSPIPVIDLFAGPGGLSEGFDRLPARPRWPGFHIALSIEKDFYAHQTLELRAFFRHLRDDASLSDYYRYLRGPEHPDGIDRKTLFSRHPKSRDAAQQHACDLELGESEREAVSERIEATLKQFPPRSPWVLLGGPPCQAYSVAGRSKLRWLLGDNFESDARHRLYKEYLAIIDAYRPPVFVMENVKGLLSSTLESERLFERLLHDLRNCAGGSSYRLFSFVKAAAESRKGQTGHRHSSELNPVDFVIECEQYGIPQCRHRVIILGIRSDLLKHYPKFRPPLLKKSTTKVPVSRVLVGLPRLRSALSRQQDDPDLWRSHVEACARAGWLGSVNGPLGSSVVRKIKRAAHTISLPVAGRGGRFVPYRDVSVGYKPCWYLDAAIGGVCNHQTREHMASDLHRYLFASCYARVYRQTPKLADFPPDLLPAHENVGRAMEMGHGMFNDRFRVQVANRPATTITCHLAKDGHYNIHPDPLQCRSLTVREAARIQTFPDNYFFEGPKTQQYVQVGNAVPPLLARQLAGIVADVLTELMG